MAYFGKYFGKYFGAYFGLTEENVEPVPTPPSGLSIARAAIARRLTPSRAEIPKARRHADPLLDQSIREARDAIKQLTTTRIPFGAPVEVTFTASATPVTVVHGLPTAPTGYIVIRKSAAIDVYDSDTETADTSTLTLEATGAEFPG